MNPTQNVTVHADRAVVTVAGSLDMDTCPHVTEATDALTLRGRILVLDLSAVTFIDSSALNMLLNLRNRAHAEGGTLELRAVPAQALRVLDITGTRGLFALTP